MRESSREEDEERERGVIVRKKRDKMAAMVVDNGIILFGSSKVESGRIDEIFGFVPTTADCGTVIS